MTSNSLTDKLNTENPADHSILLVNKPKGWTSFDVVKKLRSGLQLKKVGHAGTLDPLATGLLVICTGTKTKNISEIQDTEKEYTGVMVFGGTTESYDRITLLKTSLLKKPNSLRVK